MLKYRFIEAITSLLGLLARTSPNDLPDRAAETQSDVTVPPQENAQVLKHTLARVQAEYRPSTFTGPVRRRLLAGAKRVIWNRNEKHSEYGTRN
jgi:hypothetical protein